MTLKKHPAGVRLFLQAIGSAEALDAELRVVDEIGMAMEDQVRSDAAGGAGVHDPVAAKAVDE